MTGPVSRREVLRQMSTMAAVALMSAEPALQAAESPLKIIDTHQHLWDLKKFTLPWLAANTQLNKSFLTDDYLEAARGLNVAQAVYMEVDVAPEQQQAEADHVLTLCAGDQHPTRAAVISGRPASDRFAAYIEPLAAHRAIKGVRQVLHGASTPAGYCLAPEFVRGIRLLGKLGLRYDLCMRAAELSDAVKLADLCPDTRFVLDHCGNIAPAVFAASGVAAEGVRAREQWKRDITALAERPHVVCKISGIVASAAPGKWSSQDLAPPIDFCLDAFGPRRVMFGSDWPVCTLAATFAQWVKALQEIVSSRSQEQQRQLFYDNAAAFYGLA